LFARAFPVLAVVALAACTATTRVAAPLPPPPPPSASALPGTPEPAVREPAVAFAVWSQTDLPAGAVRAAEVVDGVVAIGRIDAGDVELRAIVHGGRARHPNGKQLSALAVPPGPLDYSPALQPVARALAAGDVAVNVATAAFRRIAMGDTVRVGAGARVVSLRVGAMYRNDSLFANELALPPRAARALGVDQARALIVAARPNGANTTADAIVKATGGDARVRTLEGGGDDTQSTVLPEAEIHKLFGSFSYVRGPGDSIIPDPRWVDYSITSWKVPVIGVVRCHRNIIAQLYYAMAEIEQRGLADLIHTYDGCYVARMQRLDDTRLSAHAYGIAIDLNAAENAQGATPVIDARIVEIMKRWGFAWGGEFDVPDGMHFEFARYPARVR
jgi:hypothetical protein